MTSKMLCVGTGQALGSDGKTLTTTWRFRSADTTPGADVVETIVSSTRLSLRARWQTGQTYQDELSEA